MPQPTVKGETRPLKCDACGITGLKEVHRIGWHSVCDICIDTPVAKLFCKIFNYPK